MASFDMNTFLALKGGDQKGALDALGMTFGMPSCLLNLAKDALSLLPAGILGGISGQASSGAQKADEVTKSFFNKLMLGTGIISYDDNGTLKFLSDSSLFGIESDEGGFADNLGGLLGAFEYGTSFASEIYSNYTDVKQEVEGMIGCFKAFKDQQSFKRSNSAKKRAELVKNDPEKFNNLINAEYGDAAAQIQDALNFIDQAERLKKDCQDILEERRLDPSLEPCFIENEILDITDFCQIAADETPPIEEISLFRLEFGPPKSTHGKFILTIDGLYYDSQEGGLDPALAEIMEYTPPAEIRYLFEHEPAAGGKGVQVTKEDIEGVVNRMFDPNSIDESVDLQKYYDADSLLQAIIGQKNKQIYDLSAEVTQLISDEGVDSAIVTNIRESLYSTIAGSNSKVDRRKKQIELAVRIPQMFDPSGLKINYPVGEIPINDFSYLRILDVGVNLVKQKAVAFKASDVIGMVKPIVPKYVVAKDIPEEIKINKLLVPPIGKAGIIHSTSATTSSTAPLILNLTDQITTKGLLAVYSYLEAEVVDPSSTRLSVFNGAGDYFGGHAETVKYNAQFLAEDPSTVFVSGLGIAYVNGLISHEASSSGSIKAFYPSSLGQAIKLPDEKEFRNIAYSREGWSFETWCYMPGFNTLNAAGGWIQSLAGGSVDVTKFSRLLLSCENVGTTEETNERRVPPKFNSDTVRGMVMGFTRDIRITENLDPNIVSTANDQKMVFFIAPTQAYSSSACTFVNKSDCASAVGWYSLSADIATTPAGGTSGFDDASAGFILISTSFDVPNDEIRIYVDGILHTTSSITSVFGTQKYSPIMVPSFTVRDSLEYGTSGTGGSSIGGFYDKFATGPLLNKGPNYSFTPWIVGGGYTDGLCALNNDATIATHVGFMGKFGGDRSGLDGYLGSTKFYTKALSTEEALKNFKAQKGFFKNIQL